MSDNPEFYKSTKTLVQNPLSLIGLFISFNYSVAVVFLSIGIGKIDETWLKAILIIFICFYPLVILGVFYILVVYHSKKLYGPGDFKDEKNYVLMTGINPEEIIKIKEKANDIKESVQTADIKTAIDDLVRQIDELSDTPKLIEINKSWQLNHWGSTYASIKDKKIIFSSNNKTEGDEDGCNVDVLDVLELDSRYEVSCLVDGKHNVDGAISLWCHDGGHHPTKNSKQTNFVIPKLGKTSISLEFVAKNNKNIRIHIQYKPGQGQIEVSDFKIKKLEG